MSSCNLHIKCSQSLAVEKLTVHNSKDFLIVQGKYFMAKSVASNYLLPSVKTHVKWMLTAGNRRKLISSVAV